MPAGSQAQAHFLHWLPGKKEEGATWRRGGCLQEDRQAGWGTDLAADMPLRLTRLSSRPVHGLTNTSGIPSCAKEQRGQEL